MDGLDKENTYVLLIGSSSYPNWEVMNIPNVKVNIQELGQLLSDPIYCGIPTDKIKIVLDENLEDTSIALQEFFDGIQTPKATVILYYSGHGLQSVKAMDDLFLATRNIRERAFEASSIRISELRSMFSECVASKKILLLDCCYAGKISRGFMSDDTSDTIAKLNEFEGTYIMAASSEYEKARFDPGDPNSPTKFTGKFVDVVKNGIGTDDEYCTLNSIYWQIQKSFTNHADTPKPIQVSKDNIGIFPLFKNKTFISVPKYEQEWKRVISKNTVYAFNAFIDKFPESKLTDEAKKRIEDIEEEAAWKKAVSRNTVGGYWEYLSYYKKYTDEARKRLNDLVIINQEDDVWTRAIGENKFELFKEYLQAYPNGKYVADSNARISILEKQELQESDWNKVDKQNVFALKEFLTKYPKGKHCNDAVLAIDMLKRKEEERQKIEEQARLKEIEDRKKKYEEEQLGVKQKAEKEQSRIKEQNAWDTANTQNTFKSFQKYLANYPKGKFADEATQKIETLNKSRASEHDTSVDNPTFIKKYWKITAGVVAFVITLIIVLHKPQDQSILNYKNMGSSVDSTAIASDSTAVADTIRNGGAPEIIKPTISTDSNSTQNTANSDRQKSVVTYAQLQNDAATRFKVQDYKNAISLLTQAYLIGKKYKFDDIEKLLAKIKLYENEQNKISEQNQLNQRKSQYEIFDNSYPSLVVVKQNGLYGAVNKKFIEIAPCKYKSPPFPPINGVIKFQNTDGNIDRFKY